MRPPSEALWFGSDMLGRDVYSRTVYGTRVSLIVGLSAAALSIVIGLTILYMVPFIHPVSTLMLKDLATFSGYDRRWVSIYEVAPVLSHSVIMSEDGQFCSHRGIDWRELRPMGLRRLVRAGAVAMTTENGDPRA